MLLSSENAKDTACLSPTNSNFRAFCGGGGRNWPSVENDATVRLLPGIHRDRRDSDMRVRLAAKSRKTRRAVGGIACDSSESERRSVCCGAEWIASAGRIGIHDVGAD